MPKPPILIVDDEPDICELLSITLKRMELAPRIAGSIGAGAKEMLKTERFDLCLTDMKLPDGDGLDLVKWIQQYSASVPVAVITAHGNMETAVRALKLGVFDFVLQPGRFDQICASWWRPPPSSCRTPRTAASLHERVRPALARQLVGHAAAPRDDRACPYVG